MAAAADTSEASAAGIALAEANINWERYAPGSPFSVTLESYKNQKRNLFILARGVDVCGLASFGPSPDRQRAFSLVGLSARRLFPCSARGKDEEWAARERGLQEGDSRAHCVFCPTFWWPGARGRAMRSVPQMWTQNGTWVFWKAVNLIGKT